MKTHPSVQCLSRRQAGRHKYVERRRKRSDSAHVRMDAQRFPNFLDCRPIFVQQAVKSAGFQIEGAERKTMWVPVEIVLGRKLRP